MKKTIASKLKASDKLIKNAKILFTALEVCEMLSISRAKLYALISEGKIQYVKIGRGKSGGVRFRPEDLHQFAENHLKLT